MRAGRKGDDDGLCTMIRGEIVIPVLKVLAAC